MLRVFGSQRLREWPHPNYQILTPGQAPRELLAISRNEISGLYLSNYLGADGRRHLEPIVRPQGLPVAVVGRSILLYRLGLD